MELHLNRLHDMHPILSLSTALEYEYRAAVGLARHRHSSGVRLAISHDGGQQQGHLHWLETSQGSDIQLDFHRVTEDAAEAVAMAVVNVVWGWTIVRRLQRREKGDWLLIGADGNYIAMEVSGIDGLDTGRRRLREKVEQVRQSSTRGSKIACVVELSLPRSRLKTA